MVEVSEAGSQVASPAHLTQEGAEEEETRGDSSLSSQLAAAIKKRKTKKTKEDDGEDKDTRGSFKKRWSLRRRSRDKNKGSPSASRSQAQESPPQTTKQAEPACQATPVGEEPPGQEKGEPEVETTEKERLLSNGSEGGIQGEFVEPIFLPLF